MADARTTTSPSPWEYSITCRLRGGARVQMFITEQSARRLEKVLDEPEDGFVVFDSVDARHALNCKHLFLHHIRRHPGTHVSSTDRDLGLSIVFSDVAAAESYHVAPDTEDVNNPASGRGCLLQLLMEEAEIGSSMLYFLDDGGDEVNFESDSVALISIPLEHVIPDMASDEVDDFG